MLSEADVGTYTYESLDLAYDKPIQTSDILKVISTPAGDDDYVEIKGSILADKFSGRSDARLKHNISNITGALDTITQLHGKKYFLKNSNVESFGLIAQEVVDILPSIVQTDNQQYLSVSYIELIPFLLESIKELNGKIKILEDAYI
jgi:hypothetical protein